MVDGKVCQALTDTPSAATCYICGAKPSVMNNLNKVKERVENIEHFEFGLSTLHAWIRFLDCVLHVSYRLEFCKWTATTKENKELMAKTKKRIHDAFRKRTGLIIDVPKQGSGNSNDGNTARRFFSDPELASEITGFDKHLIIRFAYILQKLSSGSTTNLDDFEKYTNETAKIFVQLYPWYYMPATVHKILMHGPKVMKRFHLPIG